MGVHTCTTRYPVPVLDLRVPTTSTNYQLDQYCQYPGTRVQYQKKKYIFSRSVKCQINFLIAEQVHIRHAYVSGKKEDGVP